MIDMEVHNKISVDYPGVGVYTLIQETVGSSLMKLYKDDEFVGYVRMAEIIKLCESKEKIDKLKDSTKKDVFSDMLEADYNMIDKKWD